jgi:hypothetical protein
MKSTTVVSRSRSASCDLHTSRAVRDRLVRLVVTLALVACGGASPAARAQDGQSVCDGLRGGARGLCNAYCVAQRCHLQPKGSCERLRENFAKHAGTTILPCDVAPSPSAPTPGAPTPSATPATPTDTPTPGPGACVLPEPIPEVLALVSRPDGSRHRLDGTVARSSGRGLRAAHRRARRRVRPRARLADVRPMHDQRAGGVSRLREELLLLQPREPRREQPRHL